MKKASDPRHKAREKTIKQLFSYSFSTCLPKGSVVENYSSLSKQVIDKNAHIDDIIRKAAPQWPIDKIARIDLAILRLATFELLKKEQPPKVVIDEAVELAKSYGGERSSSFVNGVLGTVYSWLSKKNDQTT